MNLEFHYTAAIPYEPGVTRRDPSPVICVDGVYYVWYSRTTKSADGYSATIWYATSVDGRDWREQGEALPAGPVGAFDEHAVFTCTVLVAEGRYYLYYTAVPEPFTNDNGGPNATRTAIGVAASDHPAGPFVRCGAEPVLRPSDDPAEFDSLRVDDTMLLRRDGRYWMYYKGRQMSHTPAETKMGLAIGDSPVGPFLKHEANPVVGSGHEVCVWPDGDGVGCLVQSVGPQGNTLQYSDDGIHFERRLDVRPPWAPGPMRDDNFEEGAGPGLRWGVCISRSGPRDWPHLDRFDVIVNGEPAPLCVSRECETET